MSALAQMSLMTRTWFGERFGEPTPVQAEGWAAIAGGAHTLMLAPTGSGKTLAAFLWCLDRLAGASAGRAPGYRVIYVSPLKALAYDVERNLTGPLAELAAVATRLGLPAPRVRIDVRTGDTPAADRRRQLRDPGELLITTPESLYLLLGSRARAALVTAETVIVDEIHALAPGKRGAHLALSLERLTALCTGAGGRDPQRIGLSATQRPLAVVARYLGGDRPVTVVDTGQRPRLDLEVVVPVADMAAPPRPPASGDADARQPPSEQQSLWPSIYPRLLELILAHRTTIIFVNSRRMAERLAQALSELAASTGAGVVADPDLVRAHHGSVARHEREQIEAALKAGRLRAITATSSLELGIDMGTVDLVIQLESPGGVARGLQRIGRAGHHVGGTPRGRIVPKFRGDLLEAAAVAGGMLRGEVEPVHPPEQCLDVLAQQLVAMCGVEAWTVDALERVIRRASGYAALGRPALTAVLDMLSGKYPSEVVSSPRPLVDRNTRRGTSAVPEPYLGGSLAELRPRLTWDRHTDVVTARRGARLLSVVNAGTIPDRGLYAVHLGAGGPRIGELDEEMVYESRAGETFVLGASTWRIVEITRDRVIVSPAPGEAGKMPFWRGEGPGRPIELGRAVGALVRTIDDAVVGGDVDLLVVTLARDHALDPLAARNLVAYVADQRAAAGGVPTDRVITVERFRDEVGDWRVCILTPLGARVHAPWALVLQRQLEDRLGYPIQPTTNDDGIAFRLADGDDVPGDDALFPDPDVVEDVLIAELARSAVFAGHFRENAARALLLPRRRPGMRTPLWAQRLRAQQLLAVALRYPEFPIVLETYRECLKDVFDVPALVETLRAVRTGELRIHGVTTAAASPFARSLVFDHVASYLYEGDAPPAERRAQALGLDRGLLRELMGEGERRSLLDPDVMAAVLAELQGLAPDRQARHPDAVHDLLLRIGDLSKDELIARTTATGPWLDELAAAGRVVAIELAGARRWIAVEDAARYRDGLGVALPAGLPPALLAQEVSIKASTPLVDRLAGWAGRACTESSLADSLLQTSGPSRSRHASTDLQAADSIVSLVARFARCHGPFTADELAARFGLPPAQAALALAALVDRGTVVTGELRPGGLGLEHCDAEVLRRLRRRTLVELRREVSAVAPATYARFLARWHGVGEGRRGLTALREAIVRLEGVAVSFAELEARILPARVADFAPRMLDELGAMGEVVWVGRGSLGARDGRIALYRRDRAAALLDVAPSEEVEAPLHRAIALHLGHAGASFLLAIEAAVRAHGDRAAVKAALWDLAWAGRITNDTFAPLRSLGAPPSRRVNPTASFGGRWSLVAPMVAASSPAAPPSPTAIAHARATALLDRWGVVGREAAAADELAGGFGSVADVLRAMEDAGKARRGHFVDGLVGSQFAWPGAVDRLRAERDADDLTVLAAVDPASPWGAVLPWPPTTDAGARPARRAGALVVMLGGTCALVVEPRGKRLITFAGLGEPALERALEQGLVAVARTTRRRSLAIETIDGIPAMTSPLAARLARLGARRDYRGFTIEVADAARLTAPPAEVPGEPLDDDELADPA